MEDESGWKADVMTDSMFQKMLEEEILHVLGVIKRPDEDESEIVAGIDTSPDAVEAYIMMIFDQIKQRGDMFL